MSTLKATNLQHASATNPAIVLAADGSATANVSSINSGPLAGFRNAIINGNFDFWQRGTSFTGNEYGADRWIHGRTGTTHTASRQAFTLGQTAVPGEPTYFCRTVVSSVAAAGNFSHLQQRIENVRSFSGQQITVSFWAKADASKPIAVELVQSFGTGGSPSSSVTGIGVTKVTLSTSWQEITFTTTFPSVSGKTLGSDANNHLQVTIWFDAGSNFNSRADSLGQQSGTFDIAQVQVERGPVATPFERRPIGTELALCQRYFCKSYELDTSPGAVTDTSSVLMIGLGTGSNHAVPVQFPVTMRDTPTITTYNPTTGASGGARRASSNVTGAVRNPGQFQVNLGTDAGGAADNSRLHFTAEAEL